MKGGGGLHSPFPPHLAEDNALVIVEGEGKVQLVVLDKAGATAAAVHFGRQLPVLAAAVAVVG